MASQRSSPMGVGGVMRVFWEAPSPLLPGHPHRGRASLDPRTVGGHEDQPAAAPGAALVFVPLPQLTCSTSSGTQAVLVPGQPLKAVATGCPVPRRRPWWGNGLG